DQERGVGFMVVIQAQAGPPSEEVRERIKQLTGSFGPHVRAFAHVVEGDGFLSAAKRAAMTLIMTASRFPFPLTAFSEMPAGMRWLMKRADVPRTGGLDPNAIVATVNELRRKHFTAA